MKKRCLFSVVLLGLASSFSAFAQTSTTPGAAGTPAGSTIIVPGKQGTDLPTAMPPGEVPASATTPVNTTGQLYPNGVPARNIDGGTQRADQPHGVQPMPGSQPTRRLGHSRPTTQP